MTELNAETGPPAPIVEHTRRLAESAAAADLTPPCRQPRSDHHRPWSRTWARPRTGSREIIERRITDPHSCHGNGRAAC